MQNNNFSKLQLMIFSSLFAALIAAGAQFTVPLPLIPITLQTFFVLLSAVFLGVKWSFLSVLIYLILGITGFPVFSSGSSGFGVILGPTGGYLYSFIPAVVIVGYISDKVFQNFNRVNFRALSIVFAACVLGSIIILFIGSVHLMFFASLSPVAAFFSGFAPFILGDLVKSVAVTAVIAALFQKRPQFIE